MRYGIKDSVPQLRQLPLQSLLAQPSWALRD